MAAPQSSASVRASLASRRAVSSDSAALTLLFLESNDLTVRKNRIQFDMPTEDTTRDEEVTRLEVDTFPPSLDYAEPRQVSRRRHRRRRVSALSHDAVRNLLDGDHSRQRALCMVTARRADMFTASGEPCDEDSREHAPKLSDERTTLVEALRCQRLTLEMKCAGLDAEAMAMRAVEPSTMSLLGLVRHLAEGERDTFRVMMAGQDVPSLYCSDTNRDGDFDGAVPNPAVAEGAGGVVLWTTLAGYGAFSGSGVS